VRGLKLSIAKAKENLSKAQSSFTNDLMVSASPSDLDSVNTLTKVSESYSAQDLNLLASTSRFDRESEPAPDELLILSDLSDEKQADNDEKLTDVV
jgi:hypothetical protein